MKINSINQTVQKENNLSVVLRELRACNECTRVRLAKQTRLAQASITKIVAQLIEWGLVEERESIGSGVGRKAVRLHLNSENYHVAAVRINRHYIIAAIYDMDGRLYDMTRCEINFTGGPESSLKKLIENLREMISRSSHPIMSIGVAVPGPFNYNTGRITLMSGFPGWNEIDIGAVLTDAFQLPVFVDQDANCGALAEMWYSNIESGSDMLFIAADRGIGAGLILNSQIYRGHDGYAGEIGHASINFFGPRCECGNRGCLELYASTIALENTYRDDLFDPMNPASTICNVSASKILELVRAGDPVACRAYSKTVTYLCFGVVGIINALNPRIVVFSDKMVNGGELFLTVARKTFQQYLMPEIYENLCIKTCTLDGDPMLLGASVLAFDHMLQTPSIYFQRADRQ